MDLLHPLCSITQATLVIRTMSPFSHKGRVYSTVVAVICAYLHSHEVKLYQPLEDYCMELKCVMCTVQTLALTICCLVGMTRVFVRTYSMFGIILSGYCTRYGVVWLWLRE